MIIGFWVSLSFFVICAFLSWLVLENVVDWASEPMRIKSIFVCLAALYVPIFPCLLARISDSKGVWSTPRTRIIAEFLIGASLGFFMAGMLAIFGQNGLEHFHNEAFERLLCGVGPETTWEQARKLLPQAELLGMIKSFLDLFGPLTLAFCFCTPVAIELYCKTRLSASTTSRKLSH